jgi:hypothetical protein
MALWEDLKSELRKARKRLGRVFRRNRGASTAGYPNAIGGTPAVSGLAATDVPKASGSVELTSATAPPQNFVPGTNDATQTVGQHPQASQERANTFQRKINETLPPDAEVPGSLAQDAPHRVPEQAARSMSRFRAETPPPEEEVVSEPRGLRPAPQKRPTLAKSIGMESLSDGGGNPLSPDAESASRRASAASTTSIEPVAPYIGRSLSASFDGSSFDGSSVAPSFESASRRASMSSRTSTQSESSFRNYSSDSRPNSAYELGRDALVASPTSTTQSGSSRPESRMTFGVSDVRDRLAVVPAERIPEISSPGVEAARRGMPQPFAR